MDLNHEDRRDWLRWALSGVIVLTVHGGIAAAMVQWRAADDMSEPTAAMVIDLAPFPVSPAVTQMDIAPGPEQVEAQAATETKVEQPDEVHEETSKTKEVTEYQPDITQAQNPEIVVAALPPKPEPQAPKPQDSQLPVPVTTAPQVTPNEVAPVAAAPAQGPRSTIRLRSRPGATASSASSSVTNAIRRQRRPGTSRAPLNSRSASTAGDGWCRVGSCTVRARARSTTRHSNWCGAPNRSRRPRQKSPVPRSVCRCRSISTFAEIAKPASGHPDVHNQRGRRRARNWSLLSHLRRT
jgi:hypothetical protein